MPRRRAKPADGSHGARWDDVGGEAIAGAGRGIAASRRAEAVDRRVDAGTVAGAPDALAIDFVIRPGYLYLSRRQWETLVGQALEVSILRARPIPAGHAPSHAVIR